MFLVRSHFMLPKSPANPPFMLQDLREFGARTRIQFGFRIQPEYLMSWGSSELTNLPVEIKSEMGLTWNDAATFPQKFRLWFW